MFDHILIPLDGSQLAECVLPHVIAIARTFDTEITLLRMLEKKQVGTSAQLFDLLNWQINKTRAELYLEKTKAYFQESGLRAQTIDLRNSGDTAGPRDEVVGYGAYTFTAKPEG